MKTGVEEAAVPELMALAMSLLLVPLAGPRTIHADAELTGDCDSDDERQNSGQEGSLAGC